MENKQIEDLIKKITAENASIERGNLIGAQVGMFIGVSAILFIGAFVVYAFTVTVPAYAERESGYEKQCKQAGLIFKGYERTPKGSLGICMDDKGNRTYITPSKEVEG